MDDCDVPNDIRIDPLIFVAELVANCFDTPPWGVWMLGKIVGRNMADRLGDYFNGSLDRQPKKHIAVKVCKVAFSSRVVDDRDMFRDITKAWRHGSISH